jgi:ribosomal peptide maturation radical SAM protein 1
MEEGHMFKRSRAPRVALVYPPYGPPNLASLGLAILSAGVKARGFACRTFYWNYRFLEALPYARREQRRNVYAMLTERGFYPWNEWAFTRNLFANELARRDPEVQLRLRALDASLGGQTGDISPSRLVQHLAETTPRLVAKMTALLAPFDVVGISTTFFQNGAALALARSVKQRWPDKLIVLGGANCDGEMGLAQLEKFPFLDCVFTGEVDHAFPEMVQRLAEGRPIGETPGILCRTPDGQILEGPAARPLTDLGALPIPDFDDYVAERRRFGFYTEGELCLPLESSRGCWWGAKHHCVFCGLNANGMAFREKSRERFTEEIQTVATRYGARYFFMADNILSAKYYRDFVQWAKQRQLSIDFFYEIKANVSRAQVADLADAGITMVQPGIESFSSKTLNLMRKGVRGIQNVAFLKYASEYGVIAAYNLLAGFPGEDPFEYEHMAKELPKLFHLRPPNGVSVVEFHRFSPYHNDPSRFGLRLRPHENYRFLYPFAEKDLARLAYFFELEGRSPQDLSYLVPIQSAVFSWRLRFDRDRCTLTWRRDGADIVVRDRRPSFNPCDWRLRDAAAALFEALDTPASLDGAIGLASDETRSCAARLGPGARAVPANDAARPTIQFRNALPAGASIPGKEQLISFTREHLLANARSCLDRLDATGIIYSEGNLHLALPVHEAARPIESGWNRIGI